LIRTEPRSRRRLRNRRTFLPRLHSVYLGHRWLLRRRQVHPHCKDGTRIPTQPSPATNPTLNTGFPPGGARTKRKGPRAGPARRSFRELLALRRKCERLSDVDRAGSLLRRGDHRLSADANTILRECRPYQARALRMIGGDGGENAVAHLFESRTG